MKKWQIIMTDTAISDLREIAFGTYEVSMLSVFFSGRMSLDDY